MVIAYHAIITTYGFWLPNDERGSWSDFVRRWELLHFGPATKTNTRRSVAARKFDRQKQLDSKAALLYPAVQFNGQHALTIAHAFADGVARSNFNILACAILPQHAHLVISRHSYPIEQVINRLKGAATRELAEAGVHPLSQFKSRTGKVPSPWAEGLWKVYLNTHKDVERAIDYVKKNPGKEGKRPQQWSFVTPFQLWKNRRSPV